MFNVARYYNGDDENNNNGGDPKENNLYIYKDQQLEAIYWTISCD